MQNNQENEYIEISVTKMFAAVFKNIKTFLAVLVMGLLMTFVAVSMWKPTYTYQQMIQPPVYIDEKGQVNVIDNEVLTSILQNIIANAQQSDPDNSILSNMDIIAPTKSDAKDPTRVFFAMSTKAKYDDKSDVSVEFKDAINQFSQSNVIKSQTELWKVNIEQNIASNAKKLIRYNGIIKQNQDYLQGLSSQKRLSGIDGQTLLSSYISRIDSYQKKVFAIEDSQNVLELKLKSLKEDLTAFANMTCSKSGKLSAFTIVALGLLFSLFVAALVVFLKVTAVNAVKDYRS